MVSRSLAQRWGPGLQRQLVSKVRQDAFRLDVTPTSPWRQHARDRCGKTSPVSDMEILCPRSSYQHGVFVRCVPSKLGPRASICIYPGHTALTLRWGSPELQRFAASCDSVLFQSVIFVFQVCYFVFELADDLSFYRRAEGPQRNVETRNLLSHPDDLRKEAYLIRMTQYNAITHLDEISTTVK